MALKAGGVAMATGRGPKSGSPVPAGGGGGRGGEAASGPDRGFLLSGAGRDDAEREPPSEPEPKAMQARRERQDKISKLMSEYLLKGYRMLGDCCEECGTILLQDKQKKLYCVTCQEPNSDVDQDSPGAASGLRASTPAPALPASAAVPAAPLTLSPLATTEEALLQKISWASQQLQESTSVARSIQLCSLIRSFTESLKGINQLQQ